MDNVHDPLEGMTNRKVDLVSYMSWRKSYMLSGSISAHLSSQGVWSVGSGVAALFRDRTRSSMNNIGSFIIILGINEAEEEQETLTETETALEVENGSGEGGAIKIRSALQTRPSSITSIKTKISVPSHDIIVIVNLLLLNSP